MTTEFSFKKEERLCSIKIIGKLFTEGKTFYQFPVRIVYLILGEDAKFPVQAAFSVSRKNIRHATDRNFIRRRMKEVYRLNKPDFPPDLTNKGLAIMFIYTAREILPFGEIEKAMKHATARLGRIIKSITND